MDETHPFRDSGESFDAALRRLGEENAALRDKLNSRQVTPRIFRYALGGLIGAVLGAVGTLAATVNDIEAAHAPATWSALCRVRDVGTSDSENGFEAHSTIFCRDAYFRAPVRLSRDEKVVVSVSRVNRGR